MKDRSRYGSWRSWLRARTGAARRTVDHDAAMPARVARLRRYSETPGHVCGHGGRSGRHNGADFRRCRLAPIGPERLHYAHSIPVSYTHLRAHETVLDLVCRLLL